MLEVTVITPTLIGREDMLADCVASIQNQILPPVAHLVAQDFFKRGPAYIRNSLVERADTEWVAFIDDDDFAEPDWLDTLVRVRADVVYSAFHIEGDAPSAFYDVSMAHVPDLESLRKQNTIPVTALVRREAFLDVGGFPLDAKYEDHELWIKLMSAGYRFRKINAPLWTYRFHDRTQRGDM